MKNSRTLGLLLGTTCLATIAMTQVSRPGETPAPAQDRQPAAAGQNNADSLQMVQQRLQQAVTTELRSGAMKHDVTIDEGSVMISLLGDNGIVAGAPAKAGSGSALDAQRKPGDTGTTTGTGRDQDAGTTTGTGRDQDSGTTTKTAVNANQQVIGVVLFSRALAPTDADSAPGANGIQAPQNRAGEAAGQGATKNAPGSNELVAFEVRRSQQGQQVELVDQSGRVAMQVQLLGASKAGRTREASAPREDREDASVGGGDPLGDPRNQDPQGKDRPRTDNTQQSDMDQANAGSSDWSIVYASVVHQLCSKHHGKQ